MIGRHIYIKYSSTKFLSQEKSNFMDLNKGRVQAYVKSVAKSEGSSMRPYMIIASESPDLFNLTK
jgi:hypothetical protein